MKTLRKNKMIFIRIDKGEKIIEQLRNICNTFNIQAAQISGIGATSSFCCGVFNVNSKDYKEIKYDGMYEILSINGNISQKDGIPYIHAHICVSDENGNSFGGHLIEATINVTCEITLTIFDGNISRVYNDEIGINELEF